MENSHGREVSAENPSTPQNSISEDAAALEHAPLCVDELFEGTFEIRYSLFERATRIASNMKHTFTSSRVINSVRDNVAHQRDNIVRRIAHMVPTTVYRRNMSYGDYVKWPRKRLIPSKAKTDVLLDLSYYAYNMLRNTDKERQIITVAVLLTKYGNKQNFDSFFQEISSITSVSFTSTSGGIDDYVRKVASVLRTGGSSLMTLRMDAALRKVVTFLVAMQFVPTLGITLAKWGGLFDEKLHFQWKSQNDFPTLVSSLLSSVADILERFVCEEGEITFTIHDEFDCTRCTSWLIKYQHRRWTPGTPSHMRKDQVPNILWVSNLNKASKFASNHLLRSGPLWKAILELKQREQSSSNIGKPIPFNVGVFGEPGTGKSQVITPALSLLILRNLGLEVDDPKDHVCILNSGDQYFSTYDPHKHLLVQIDEMGDANYKNDRGNTLLTQFTRMLGENEFHPTRAAVEDKGNTKYRPNAHICVSNFSDFGLTPYINDLSAAYRRFNIVLKVQCRSRYRRTNGKGLDFSKIPEDSQLDAVLFEIFCAGNDNNLVIDPEFHPPGSDITYTFNDVLRIVDDKMRRHMGEVDTMTGVNSKIKELFNSRCDLCKEFGKSCTCTRMESTSGIMSSDAPNTFQFEYNLMIDSLYSVCEAFVHMVWAFWSDTTDNICRTIMEYKNMFLLVFPILYIVNPVFIAIFLVLVTSNSIKNAFSNEHSKRFFDACNCIVLFSEKASDEVDAISLSAKQVLASHSKLMLRVYEAINNITVYSTAVLSVVAGYHLLKCVNYDKKSKEPKMSSTSEIGSNPGPLPGVTKNAWHSIPGYIAGGSCSAVPDKVWDTKIKRCTMRLYIYAPDTDKLEYTHVTAVKGQYFIGAWHALETLNLEGSKYSVLHHNRLNNGSVINTPSDPCPGGPGMAYQVPGSKDLGIICLRSCSSFPNILEYFGNGCVLNGHFAEMTSFANFYDNGPPVVYQKDEGFMVRHKTNISVGDKSINVDGILFKGSNVSFNGRCGSSLTARYGSGLTQKTIIGINIAGRVGFRENFYEHVTQNQIKEAIALYDDEFIPTVLSLPLAEFNTTISTGNVVLKSLNERNHWHWLDCNQRGDITFYGNWSNAPTTRNKSKVVKMPSFTKVWDLLPDEYKHEYVIPKFNPIRIDGTYVSPYTNAFGDFAQQIKGLDHDRLTLCAKSLIGKFCRIDQFKCDQFLDVYTAINGHNMNAFCTAIPRSTGAGLFMGGKKHSHLVSLPTEQAPDGMVLKPDIQARLDSVIETAKTKQRNGFVFKCSLKDEPRDRAKVAQRKIRVFTVGPLDLLVLSKMSMGMFLNIFVQNFVDTETVCGVNPFSSSWGVLHDKLSKHPNVLNGDFSKYDKKLPSILIMACFTVVIHVKKKTCGLTKEEENILVSIASDIANPILSIDRDLVLIPGSLSSGVLQTLLTNNIANSLLFRYAYVCLCPDPMSVDDKLTSFEENVCFYALGDDTCVTVSDSSVKWFNMITLQKWFASVGIKYTGSDKGDITVPCLSIDEATIGKRKWVWDEEFELWKCPLEKHSIGKMITIGIASSSMTLEEQEIQSWESAWVELAQYGRDEYEKFIPIYVELFGAQPPPYETHLEKQKNSSCVPWKRESYDFPDDSFILLPRGSV